MKLKFKTLSHIFLCITIIISYIYISVNILSYLTQSYSEFNDEFSDKAVYIYDIEGTSNTNEYYISLYNTLKNKNNIIIKLCYLDVGFENRECSFGIYYNQKYNTDYNFIEGSFFNKSQMESDEKLVVIGKNILEKCIYENNEKYLFRENEKYKVIGVIGDKDTSSIYDNYIFYNLNSIINTYNQINLGCWIIDSTTLSSSDFMNTINSNESISNKFYIDDMEKDMSPLKQAISHNKNIIFSLILISITLFLALIQSFIFWINKLKLEIGVRLNYGASKSNIISLIIKKYLLCVAFSIIPSTILIMLLHKYFSNYFKITFSLLISILTILILCILSILPILITNNILNKKSITSLLKEGDF